MIKHYISIARIDHWFKNIFILPGIVLALDNDSSIGLIEALPKIGIGLISICLIASANYVINEWLDAEFDKYHPKKKNRPSITQNLEARWVYFEYGLLAIIGLVLANFLSFQYFAISLVFLFMGFLYNVQPFRTKDRIYVDVLSESFNNPLRLLLGWTIISLSVPPSSLLISYWMGGAFLMATKRFSEYRFIGNKEIAGLYRKSFKLYTEEKLLISIVFYALMSSFFLAAFLIKHKIEMILSFPLFSILFVWYLKIGFRKDSPVQRPEKLYKEKYFMIFMVVLSLATFILAKIEIPILDFLLE